MECGSGMRLSWSVRRRERGTQKRDLWRGMFIIWWTFAMWCYCLILSDYVVRRAVGWAWVKWWYMNYAVVCSRNQTVADFVCETAVLRKDKELSRQLTCDTRICELACMLNENILSKYYYDVDNLLKFERAWNFNMVISARAAWITFKHMRFKNQLRFWKVIARISQRTFFLRHSV